MTTLVSGGVSTGTILAFAGDIAPEGYLIADGSLLNRNDFANLFAVIGTAWGTSSILDFRIPTTQGLLLRGRANGSGFDPDRNSRTAIQTGGSTGDNVGSYQSNRLGSHNHAGGNHNHIGGISPRENNPRYGSINIGTKANQLSDTDFNDQSPLGAYTSTASLNLSAAGGNQTIGSNVYVNYIIKL